MQVLASFGVALRYAGPCIYTDGIVLEQKRAETLPEIFSFDIALDFDRTRWDAIMSRTRWTGSLIELGSSLVPMIGPAPGPPELIVIGRVAALSFEDSMTPGEQATMRFSPVGDRWAIPSQDFLPAETTTCPSETVTSAPRTSPKSFGNKATNMRLLLGKSPAAMQEFRLFQGQTLQKSFRGNVAITGEVTAVDDSIIYADTALCLSIPPFSGLRRDQIVRMAAEAVGLDPRTPGPVESEPSFSGSDNPGSSPLGHVICPIGRVVNKPILLSNASLLPWLNEFIAAENWFASFNEYGQLWVRPIELKRAPELPDWTLDAALGDFDFDTLEETPPAKPPSDIIVNLTKPVKGTGPGGNPLTITTVTTEEDQELYNPECVKVPPSGATSWLLGDGSYHLLPAEELMLVSRKVTEITTVDGHEMSRVIRLWRHYNPAAYDPNFDSDPPGTSYDGAYGNKTFHRDECESLMVIFENAVLTARDIYGTILGTVDLTKTWYAPHRAGNFSLDRKVLTNDAGATPPAYVYAGGSTRVIPTEVYGVTQKIEKDYLYGDDGALRYIDQRTSAFYAPDSRCDLIQTTTTPDTGPPTDESDPEIPPITNPPPPEPPPPPPPFHPVLTGPIEQVRGLFTFRFSVSGGPQGPTSGGTVTFKAYRLPPGTFPPPYGSIGGTPDGHNFHQSNLIFTATAPDCLLSFDMTGEPRSREDPPQTFYVVARIFINSIQYWSNTIVFDPWAGVAPGDVL
jgi:hypothetical protein